jgi:hypothetical protein
MSWQDRPFEHADETISFNFVQWVNDGGSLEPRADKGGFACPVDQDIPIPGKAATIHHRGGSTTDVIFTQELSVAILRTRFAWVKDGLRVAEYTDGARGKLQAVGYVVGADGAPVPEPVMLTFTGLASREFGQVRRQFTQSVRRATKGQAPAYAFWMHLRAGEVTMAGSTQQSPITTVELAREVDPDQDYLGDALVDAIPWPDVLAWADAWKSPGPNGTGVMHESDEEEDDAPETPSLPEQAGPPVYQEGTVEWASEIPLPFDGNSVSKGTPLGELSDNALRYIVDDKARQFPKAAKAARILMQARQEVRQEDGEYEPPF